MSITKLTLKDLRQVSNSVKILYTSSSLSARNPLQPLVCMSRFSWPRRLDTNITLLLKPFLEQLTKRAPHSLTSHTPLNYVQVSTQTQFPTLIELNFIEGRQIIIKYIFLEWNNLITYAAVKLAKTLEFIQKCILKIDLGHLSGSGS